MFESLGLGITAGLALAIPMGPMALLLIQTTMSKGYRHGIAGGLAMASVDFTYALIASYAGIWLSTLLGDLADLVTLIGAVFLIYLAIDIYLKARKFEPGGSRDLSVSSVGRTYIKFFGATMLNPPTALYFLAIAPSLAISTASAEIAALWFGLGVLIGSGFWQQFLAAGAGWLAKRITPKVIFAISVIGSCLIVLMATQIMLPVILKLLG